MYTFENLEVWRRSLDYVDAIYALSSALPDVEKYNLASQIRRAATSIPLNIAEGAMGQTDAEQVRFLGMALRSVIETVACQRLIARRHAEINDSLLDAADAQAQMLIRKLKTMRNKLHPDKQRRGASFT